MTRKELYNICHDEAVAYANSEQWSKRTGEEKSFLIQGYLDAMMEARKSEITEKKKEYPKTYEECCNELGIEGGRLMFNNSGITQYERDLYISMHYLSKLLICRDAYWKIAGEEMGLDKSWNPISAKGYCTYAIIRHTGHIRKSRPCADSALLEFPTEEMRDAFYENFKELIEQCKELLS